MATRAVQQRAGRDGATADARVTHMVARHERSLMRIARHWSLCRDDALDAYQRALEIYVRRLDSLDPATEIAWLKVVVKHEALAVRRQRAESVPVDDIDVDGRAAEAQRPVDDLLAGRERVTRSAEALRRLKPDEAKALMLKAEGLSYQEIGESLGWTYTKVNRCITEGRARFLKVYAEIEAGAECERFAPTLAALVGGTATAGALLELRPHIRNCATCRATVRELHATRLGRLGALWPIPALLAPLRWITARVGERGEAAAPPDAAATDPDPIPNAYDAVRDLQLPDTRNVEDAERFFDLKAHVLQWWHRLLSSDVATSAQLAASAGGGGRAATIGAILGFCLSGIGAGTVCVVTGIVDSPFAPKPNHRVVEQREPERVGAQPRRPRPVPTTTPSPGPQPAARTAAPRRTAPPAKQRKPKPRDHEQPAAAPPPVGSTKDFAFEEAASAAQPVPAQAPANGGGEFAP